jgi:hypothetical protein
MAGATADQSGNTFTGPSVPVLHCGSRALVPSACDNRHHFTVWPALLL